MPVLSPCKCLIESNCNFIKVSSAYHAYIIVTCIKVITDELFTIIINSMHVFFKVEKYPFKAIIK